MNINNINNNINNNTNNNTNNNPPRHRRTRPRTAALVQGVNNQNILQERNDLNLDITRLAPTVRHRRNMCAVNRQFEAEININETLHQVSIKKNGTPFYDQAIAKKITGFI